MSKRSSLAVAFGFVVLAVVGAYPQTFPNQGVDTKVPSLGIFKIQVADKFAPAMAGCPGYDDATKTFTSPLLRDGNTVIGRSNPLKEGDPADQTGVPVGATNNAVTVGDNNLFQPSGFAVIPTGTREVHTEIHKLNMVSIRPETAAGGQVLGGVRVRAGTCYNDPGCPADGSGTPGHLSPGEVISKSDNSGDPTKDFPARSYFNVFVQVDIPACGTGGFTGATLYNKDALIVQNSSLTNFPPDVIYTHDISTDVQILFKDNGAQWKQNEMLGYFLLAGHGIGPTTFSNPTAFVNTVIPPNPILPPPLCPPCKKDGGPTLISFAVLAGLLAILSIVGFLRRRRSTEI